MLAADCTRNTPRGLGKMHGELASGGLGIVRPSYLPCTSVNSIRLRLPRTFHVSQSATARAQTRVRWSGVGRVRAAARQDKDKGKGKDKGRGPPHHT